MRDRWANRRPDPTDVRANVTVTEAGCWIWRGTGNAQGYRRVQIDGHRDYVHRTVYRMLVGPIPEGKCVLHSCDNPPCCNPAHLHPGTKGENNQEAIDRGLKPPTRGERHGFARLTEEDVREIRRRALAGTRGARLAREFGVHDATIRNVLDRRTWKHVA